MKRIIFVILIILLLVIVNFFSKLSLGYQALFWFLLFILLHDIAKAIIEPGALRDLIMNFSEKSFFKSKVDMPNDFQQKETYFTRFPLPKVFLWIILLQFMTLAFPQFLSSLLPESFTLSRKFIALILFPIGFLCIGIGLFIHFQPNSERERKYTFLLLGESIFLILKSLQDKDLDLLDLWIGNFIYVLFLFGVIGTLLTWWLKSNLARKNNYPSPRIRKTYKLVKILSFGTFMFLWWPADTMLYLLFRYLLTEYMRLFPIVYLRSFNYKESTEVFAKLIAEASRFGVIVCLVHEKQKTSEVFARTHINYQGQTFTISDEFWQDWVLDKLRRSSVVIIDSSVGSESVDWEISTALNLVDPSRIILLNRKGTIPELPRGYRLLTYDLSSKESVIETRMSFRKILKDIFTKSPEQVKKEKTISESVEEISD